MENKTIELTPERIDKLNVLLGEVPKKYGDPIEFALNSWVREDAAKKAKDKAVQKPPDAEAPLS